MTARTTDGARDIDVLEEQCRQYAAIAELGRVAIDAEDAETLIPRAKELCKAILGIDVEPEVLLDSEAFDRSEHAATVTGDDRGFVDAIVNVLGRVRQRRERERLALAEVEGRFERIFQESPVALAMSAVSDGRVLDVNERWLSTMGYERDEVIGRTNAELRISLDQNQRQDIVRDALAARVMRDVEMKVRTRSGAIIDLLVSAVALSTDDGVPVFLSACVDITDRKLAEAERSRLIERIRAGIERQRALSRRLLGAQEEERRRLAVELHDELGQVLTAVKINLESLARAKGPAPTFATMTATIQSVDDAMLRVRDLALDLRPSVLDDLGLAAAIRWFADRFASAAPIETHLSIDALPALDAGVQTACFRVAQEALTNVERHSRARQVWLDLHVLSGALELSVRDDGIGFDVAAARARAIGGGSVGLLGMQERVALLGGEYDVVQVASGGTEVRARFPLPGATS